MGRRATGIALAVGGALLLMVGALAAGSSTDSAITGSGSGGEDPAYTLWLLGSAGLVVYGLYKAFGGRRPSRANRQAEYERLQRDAEDLFPSSPFEKEWPGEGEES